MKNTIKLLGIIALAAVIGFTMVACSKSGGGTAKINVKNNDIIGAIPRIYANYYNGLSAADDKKKAAQDEAQKKNNTKKYTAADEAYKKTTDELDTKFEAERKAEWAKVNGRAVPFTMSDKFKGLKLDVTSVTVDGEKGGFNANIVASEDLRVNSMNMNNYTNVWCKFLAKDGSTIADHSFFMMAVMNPNLLFTQGQSLHHAKGEAPSGFINYSDKWADFASIQFIVLGE
jgi:hypothetical protein